MLPDARVVALQLNELPKAYPSEETSVEDEDDVLVAAEVGERDVDVAISDRKAEVWRDFAAFGRRRSAGNRNSRDECCDKRD